MTPRGVLFGGFIQIEGDTIVAVEPNTTPLPTSGKGGVESYVEVVQTPWVIPGFVDIHNHGLGGCDEVCDHWLFPEFTQRRLAQCGTLSTLASVIFSSTRQYAVNAVLRSIESRVGRPFSNCAVIEGIHAEGPIIQDRGGLPPVEAQLTLPRFQALCGRMPSMKVMTISPSQEALSSLPKGLSAASHKHNNKATSSSEGGFERMQHLVNLGVRVSLGHDRSCNEDEILRAIALRPTMSPLQAWMESLRELEAEGSENLVSSPDGPGHHSQPSQGQHRSGVFATPGTGGIGVVAASQADPISTTTRIAHIEASTPPPTEHLKAFISTLRQDVAPIPASSSSSTSSKMEEATRQRCHSTHMFNVMSNHHRNPSLGNLLMCKEFPAVGRGAGGVGNRYKGLLVPTVELITDLIHVHPLVVQSLLSARDPKTDIALISDCISSYDPGKRLKYNGRTIAVQAEGGCYLCDPQGKPTPTLAGSTVTLADQFYVLITHFRQDVTNACLMLATTPAKIANINDRVGSLEVGKKANVLLVNGEMNTITRSIVYGSWVDAAPYRMLRPSHL